MNIRKAGFYLVSKVKRTPVSGFLKEFEMESKEKQMLSSTRLEKIVDKAKNNTTFYSSYNSFADFPVISKSDLREAYEDFLSTEIKDNKTIKATTSGSTGQPVTFYLSQEKKYRQNAEVIFYNSWGKLNVGDYHAYVRVTSVKSKLKLFVQNEILMNPKSLNDEWLSDMVDKLKNKKITSIIGYPSAISAIARKALEKKYSPNDFHVKGVVTSAESLQEKDSEAIRNAFGTTPVSRYSTEEFGVLATSCPQCGKFHVNDTGYMVEILDINTNKPVSKGETGKIVVTDLFSDYMPLIRFDTGDLAVYSGESECSFYKTGIALDEIIGRQVETIYNTSEEKVSAFAINGALRDFNSIKQYQFIQNTPEDNIISLVINEDFDDNDKSKLLSRLNKIIGTLPSIEYLKEIPASKSGKRPYIVSKYNK